MILEVDFFFKFLSDFFLWEGCENVNENERNWN